MAANCYRTIKIHFKRGEPDSGKKQNDIVADIFLVLLEIYRNYLKEHGIEEEQIISINFE